MDYRIYVPPGRRELTAETLEAALVRTEVRHAQEVSKEKPDPEIVAELEMRHAAICAKIDGEEVPAEAEVSLLATVPEVVSADEKVGILDRLFGPV